MAYTVPQLKDFSPAALDKAVEKLLAALEKESAALGDEDQRKTFRDRWLARKDGILTQVNELWLKAAPKEAKREVGQRVNKLKAEVEAKVEAALAQGHPARTAEFPQSTFPFPAFAARSAPSTRSSARRTKSSRCFAIWDIRWPKVR